MVQEKATDNPKCSNVSFSRLISQCEKSPRPSLEKIPVVPNPQFWTKDVGGGVLFLSFPGVQRIKDKDENCQVHLEKMVMVLSPFQCV